ncbi:MAG TPA: phosphoenolpyruvate--protein phosphotransferase [Thermoanaerobaculia bacterium]|nr:phosphoenolpyruvate--protein phosphotransferase [Thermoanaerobaculia bacterium]
MSSPEMRPEMQKIQGMGVSGGIAIGRAVVIETRMPDVFRIHLAEEKIEPEVTRLHEAAQHAKAELKRTRAKALEAGGQEIAGIFDAHVLLLSDRAFLGRVEERIRTQQINAEWAVHKTAEELDDRFARIDNSYLRSRSEDLSDVSKHLLRSLHGISHHEISELPENVVIVADDLTPSDAIRLGRERVLGFAVESGGRTSHTTIIARSLNLPLVAGLSGVTSLLSEPSPIVVDGENGTVILHPTPEVLERYRVRQAELQRRDLDLRATRELEARTRDGVEIKLMANIDLPEEIPDISCFGAAGVGLYRSEFLYIDKSPQLPTEEEHLAIYRSLIEASAPHPAIIRTYDLGGRKLAREVMDSQEENPVLGLRGIRLTLARPDVFRTQIRALLRAGLYGDLWVMLPLISTLDELRRFRAFADEVMAEMDREGVPYRRDIRLRGDDRSARGGHDRRHPGARGAVLLDRHQRPDPVLDGGGPQQRARGRPLPAAAPGDPAHAALRDPERQPGRDRDQPVRRDGGRSPLRHAADRARPAAALDEPAPDPGGQDLDSRDLDHRAHRAGGTLPAIQHGRRGPAACRELLRLHARRAPERRRRLIQKTRRKESF